MLLTLLKNNLRTLGFAVGPWAIYSQVLGRLCRYRLHLMEWALSRIRYWCVCATNALTYCAGRDSIVDQVAGLVFSFLFWYHAECFPVPKMLEHRDKGSM